MVYLKYFFTKNKPNDTKGPIPNAYITVPMPIIPPKYQPIATAVNSIKVLITEIERFVIF